MSSARHIKVAAAQLAGWPLGQAADALAQIETAVADAAAQDVDLLVLPECAYPAYHLGSVEAFSRAERISSEDFVRRLSDLCSQNKIAAVCGLVEEADGGLHNTAVVIDAQGNECGRHRKNFLWGEDNDWVRPGDCIRPIDTPLGRIGIVICADGRAPEIAMGLVAQGAQLICVPTCWVNVADTPGRFRNAQAEFMIKGRAIETRVPIVAADKYGQETDTVGYCGMSMILDAQANVLAQSPPDGYDLITADVELSPGRNVEVPVWARRRIFADIAPVSPEADAPASIKVAVAPGCLARALQGGDDSGDASGCDLVQQLANDGVQVLGTHLPDEEFADRVEIYGRALGITVVGFPFVERLMIERFGAFGCIASDHLESFVAARVMALDGASIVFVAGEQVDSALVRTRAAENCVFVAAAFERSVLLVAPTGEIICEAGPDSPEVVTAEIDLAMAARKEVYPGTHIWHHRKPRLYAQAFDIHESFVELR